METVNKKVVLIAVILAFFTAFMVYTYIKKETTTTKIVEQIDVYVAAKTMPAKYQITEADIKIEKVAKEYLNARAVLNKADIVGKRLKDSVIAGEQILSDRLVDVNKSSLSYRIPEGKRAVSINVDEQRNVSNLVRPGDSVDIIASFGQEEVKNGSTSMVMPQMSKIVLQNIEVLAISQDMAVTTDKVDPPKTITLAVDVKDVEKFVYASEYASLRLSLRPVEDKNIEDTAGAKRSDLTPGVGTVSSNQPAQANGQAAVK